MEQGARTMRAFKKASRHYENLENVGDGWFSFLLCKLQSSFD
jgi:hypothetical protein